MDPGGKGIPRTERSGGAGGGFGRCQRAWRALGAGVSAGAALRLMSLEARQHQALRPKEPELS